MTERLTPDRTARAAELLRAGGLVAFATETVYGLGADARNGQAVARVFEAKGRPAFNPLIVHLARPDMAADYVVMSPVARRLADAFWPGPLTLVLPLRPDAGLSPLVTAGLASVGLRVPAHPGAQRLLAEAGIPVAAPSANRSGRISATTADHVLHTLDGRIDAVLDCGPCGVGLESTILIVEEDRVTLAREGGLQAESIETLLGHALIRATSPGQIVTPGQMLSHYAPEAPVRLNATAARPSELLLGFGKVEGAALNLSASADLREAAANLFSHLHALDARAKGRGIAVSPIPETGLGRAINDRLRRAAA